MSMFTWDKVKETINRQKHGVAFAEAAVALDDPMAVIAEDDRHDEHRFQAIGMDAQGRVLTIIFTYRAEEVRIISARKAEKWERKLYEG